MAYKLMYIPNDDTQNYPFPILQYSKRLDFQLNDPLGTSVINSPKDPAFVV